MAETPHSDRGHDELRLTLLAQGIELAEARRWVRGWLSARRVLPKPLLADIELALTELLTNAREASPRPDSPVDVSVELTEDGLSLTVRNVGELVEPQRTVSPPTHHRGRGLMIVRSLASHFELSQHGRYVAASALFDAAK